MKVQHLEYMAQAIRLAEKGLYTTMPNPRVGCVLVKGERVIGLGWHQCTGDGHAEVNALANAESLGESSVGATAYVTLEPCSHSGKTGPCCEALLAAGVKAVVYGMEDPNPEVGGRGLEFLEAAGVEVIGPIMEDACRDLNPGFIRRMQGAMPFIRAKLAMSLDGRTAMANGESKWITTPAAREDVQRLRARSCAIVSGVDSILQDNPSMTVREAELGLESSEATLAAAKQPLRVILDSNLRLSDSALLFDQPGPVLLVALIGDSDKGRALLAKHSQLEILVAKERNDQIDLHWLMRELASRGCNEILVETGATLAGSFLRRGLLDEIIIYMAPKLLGSKARPIFELPLESMSAHLPLFIDSITSVGRDWKIIARPDIDG